MKGKRVDLCARRTIKKKSVTLRKGDKTTKELPLIRNRKPTVAKAKNPAELKRLKRKQRLEARRAARKTKIQAAKNRARKD